ncbi:acyl-CoA dehydrogenase (plasmid) [Aminobacter sp. Y103A]|uniref:3-sulfinopropanoyl-CoA desulfinase n=1 Tax=Aminobacter aminovorans TaxID=83263 RepID=A0AAC9ATN1_AMIAI|nr:MULTISPECIES: acyl-CoA dehydrogenase family protein [Aminobacter]AMS45283.1 acyl-CoA dehydrogenase [Aminobacter aminovorans]MBB3704952.1 alkylation response protein AidB-like acyl-CoA dehydrogenase [Aminobacter aminovorans]BBD41256.1 acyl-CoA dehydrogenase [Aminobacter sp. SS-2016]
MKIFEQQNRRRQWSDDERMILEQVTRLAEDIIAPKAEHIDRTGEFPHDTLKALNDLGLNGIFVPEAYGGTPMSYRLYLEIVKTISEACASTGIIYATNYHAMKPLVDFGNEEQKARLLPRIAEGGLAALAITEASAGSDATGMKTSFKPDGDDIVINGGKLFITNGDVADLVLLFGKWAGIDDPRKAISVLILEKGTPGFEVVRLEDKMGHRGSSTAAISFTDCRVPRQNLIGQPGEGLSILLASLNKSRPSIAAHALGIARAAFADMVGYANERRQSGKRIIEFQSSQFTIADLATDLAFAELWLDYVAELVDGAVADFGIEASMAKMRASDLAMRLTTEAVQMYGGYGYTKDYRVERLMRDAKITQIWEGTNQVHRQLIGRSFVTK